MPIGPNQVTQFRRDTVQALEIKIDETLRSPRILDRKTGAFPDYHLHLTFDGSLYPEEKTYIEEAYMKAGWFAVEIRNSEEGGERPGLVGVILFATEKAFVRHETRMGRLKQKEVNYELSERKRMDALEASREAAQGGIDD